MENVESINYITIGHTTDKWPMISNIWEFFSAKANKCVFISVGSSPSPLPELDILEQIACSLYMYEPVKEQAAIWEDLKSFFKTRKETSDLSSFAREAGKKWVLARNLNIINAHIAHFNGSINDTTAIAALEAVSAASKQSGLNEEETRIDLLKIDLAGSEADILHYILQEGFRPSMILVRWSARPDFSLQVTNAAANLQMIGYKLMQTIDNKYLYYFTDKNFFEICSWEDTNVDNPLIHTLMNTKRAPTISAPIGNLLAEPWPEPVLLLNNQENRKNM
jgi:hypothetical protein